jgi:predicted aspartyl protease
MVLAHRALFALLATACAALAGCAAESPAHCTIAPAASLPLQAGSGHVFTTVVLNGQPVRMIVDTGAQVTVVSRQVADQLGLRAMPAGHATGIGGAIDASLFFTKTFQIGQLHGRHFPLLISDFNFPLGAQAADGLLGADFLSSYDVDVDNPDMRLDLYTVTGGCGPGAAFLDPPLFHAPLLPSGKSLDFRPLVAVRMNDRRFLAMVDTGSPRTIMFHNAAERAGLGMDMPGARPVKAARGVGQRAVPAVLVVAPLITIGEIGVHNMPIEIVDQVAHGDDPDMLIGLDLLVRVHAWFSFATHDLVMQVPPRPSPPWAKTRAP